MTRTGEPGVWAGIVGQPAAVALLQRAIALDRLAHAYAFVGPAGVGRRLTAVAYVQAALCAERAAGRAAYAGAWPPASTRTATSSCPHRPATIRRAPR